MTREACRQARAAVSDAALGVSPPWQLDGTVAGHLEDCARCLSDAEDLALAAHAMRRFARETALIEPSEEALAGLRARVARRRRRFVPSLDVASVVGAMSLTIALTLRIALPSDVWAPVTDIPAGSASTMRLVDRRYDPPARIPQVPGYLAVASLGPSAPPADLRLLQVALDRTASDPVMVWKSGPSDFGFPTVGHGPA